MRYSFLIGIIFLMISCKKRVETQFSELALKETLVSIKGDTLQFNQVIRKYQGKKILIDVWATWCGDCIKGMPKIVDLQKKYPNVNYLFISIDESLEDLQKGVKKYNVKGEHYLLPSKWEGNFSKFLDLSWIPRYLAIDEQGKILVFNEVDANAKEIQNALK